MTDDWENPEIGESQHHAGHKFYINPLNAKLNPICHLLALLGGATIVVVSRLRVNCSRIETGSRL